MLTFAKTCLLISLLLTIVGCMQINKNLTIEEAKRNYYEGNHARAFRLTEALATKGDVKSKYALGYMYFYGIGAPQNKPLGAAWIKQAANDGYPPAIEAFSILANC